MFKSGADGTVSRQRRTGPMLVYNFGTSSNPQPGRVIGVRPRLVVTGRNEERVPPRRRIRRSTPGGRAFNAAFYRVANRPVKGQYPDAESEVSEDDDRDEDDVPLDDGRHHNRDNWNHRNNPRGPGGGGMGGGHGVVAA